jgi:hypothetical protein
MKDYQNRLRLFVTYALLLAIVLLCGLLCWMIYWQMAGEPISYFELAFISILLAFAMWQQTDQVYK